MIINSYLNNADKKFPEKIKMVQNQRSKKRETSIPSMFKIDIYIVKSK